MIPESYHIVYSADQIAHAVERLGAEITPWANAANGADGAVIAIPILRGGIYFFSDLTRKLDAAIELAPIRVRTYVPGAGLQQLQEVEIVLDGLDVEGRTILLVDDICDTGRTLKTLTANLSALGAREIRSVVLLRREVQHPVFEPDWTGFRYAGEEFFVGYGLDDNNRSANLPDIYVIR
jgi:hypoxanthine phosphoribosyltransferase